MGSRLLGLGLGMVILLAAAGSAAADWLEPRSLTDCNMYNSAYPFQSRLDAVDQQAKQCEDANTGLAHSAWVGSCRHLGPRACLPVYRQACAIQDEMNGLREKCMVRYEAWREIEAAEKKRREAQERAEKETRNAVTFGRQVPQGISSGVRAAMGVTGGAWPLSEALTRGGTAGVNGIQQRALNQLMARMGGVDVARPSGGRAYSATYPRRSQSQFDQTLSSLDDAARRVEAMDSKLPFGGHSVVAGAYANIVTQLVEAQAQGHINKPLAAIGIAIATWVAWEATEGEIEMKKEERKKFGDAVAALLPQQQTAAMTLKEALDRQRQQADRQRFDPTNPPAIDESGPTLTELEQAIKARESGKSSAEVLETNPNKPNRSITRRDGEDLDASYCVSVIRDGSFADLTNNCPFATFYRCNDKDDPGRDKIAVGKSLTVYGCPYLAWGFRKRSFFETLSPNPAGGSEPENPPCTLRHQGREISAYECSGIQ